MKFYIVAIISLILDQSTKFLILTRFSDKPTGYSESIIGDFFCFTFVKNEGGAFGLKLIMSPWAVLISSVFILCLLTYYVIKKEKSSMLMYGLPLILGGAVGNLVDRMRFGYVIDFLDFKVWPVFNIADITITAGVIMVIFYLLFTSPEAKSTRTSPVNTEVDKTFES